MQNIYSEIANGNREAMQTEIEKQENNLEKYRNCKYENNTVKKMSLSSINGIKELMYSVAEIAARFNYEDLQIKAGFVATNALSLHNQFINEINAQPKNTITMHGVEVEFVQEQ